MFTLIIFKNFRFSPTNIMEDLRKHLSSYLSTVPGLLGIVLSDREGVPLVRANLQECPEQATKPAFLTNYTGSTQEQAGKMGLGSNTCLIAVYNKHQVIHAIHMSVIITMVATSEANTGYLTSLVGNMKPFLADISNAVTEP